MMTHFPVYIDPAGQEFDSDGPAEAPASRPVESWSVRELIAELAVVEAAIRRTPALPPDGTAPGACGLNPQFAALVDRERHIVATLRARRVPRYVPTGPGGTVLPARVTDLP